MKSLNRAIFLPLLLAGCSPAVDRQKSQTDANQAEKLHELQTRIEELERRVAVDEVAAAPRVVRITSPIDDGTDARVRRLERDKIDRDYEDAQRRFKDSVAQ